MVKVVPKKRNSGLLVHFHPQSFIKRGLRLKMLGIVERYGQASVQPILLKIWLLCSMNNGMFRVYLPFHLYHLLTFVFELGMEVE